MNKRTLQSLILGIAIGMAVGLGVYTFVYAKRQDSLSRRTIMIVLSPLSAQIRLASGQSGAQTPY